MTLAFVTGAMAAGLAAAGLTALAVWVTTVVASSTDAWSVAPWLLPGVAGIVAVATYVAEWLLHRRSMVRMASRGEPWAYRDR